MTARAPDGRLVASLSLDLDNLWSYMKTHGDPAWSTLPTYLPSVVPHVLELFDSFDVTGTVFVVGQDTEIDENAEPIAAIAAAGHEIGNHSFHHEPWLHQYSPAQLVDELQRTEEGLLRITGRRPIGFRGPGYSVSRELLHVLADRGYRYDASTLPTWIGPFARAYYFRSAHLTPDERRQRSLLFGKARDGARPVHAYLWRTDPKRLVELPVTTFPMVRVPIHFSYLLYLHGVSPRLARAYFSAALGACERREVGPSLLLHPLDLIDATDAPGVGFFPGMSMSASEKRSVIEWAVRSMTSRFAVGSVSTHASALADGLMRVRDLAHV